MTPSPTTKPGEDRTAEYVAPRPLVPSRVSVSPRDSGRATRDAPAAPVRPSIPFFRWLLRLLAFTLIALAVVAGLTIVALVRLTPAGDPTLAELRSRIRLLPLSDAAGGGAGSGAARFHLALSPDGSTLTLVPMLMDGIADPELRDRYILGRLLDPPENEFFRPAIPKGTRLTAFYRTGDIVCVDLSAGFLEAGRRGGEAAPLAVASVVRTVLANNPHVQGVRILADGRPVPPDWGGPDLARPIGR